MTTDRVAGAALALLAVYVLWASRALPLGSLREPGPAYMPTLLALLLLVLAGLVLLLGRRAPRLAALDWSEGRHAAAIFAVCGFAALVFERLGYRLTVGIVLVVLLGVVERKGVLFTLTFAAALSAGSFFVFDTLLRVPLPLGAFGF